MLAAVLAGCSGASGDGSGRTAANAEERHAGDSHGEAQEPSPDPGLFAFGQSVQIADHGVVPRQLIAIVGEEVTFENRSSTERVIEFTNGAIDAAGTVTSGPIPPGGRFSYRPATTGSIAYRAGDEPTMEGRVQVDPGVKTL